MAELADAGLRIPWPKGRAGSTLSPALMVFGSRVGTPGDWYTEHHDARAIASPAATGADRFELLLPLRGLIALAIVLHHVAGLDMGWIAGAGGAVLPDQRALRFFIGGLGHCSGGARYDMDSAADHAHLARLRTGILYLLCVFGLRDEARPGPTDGPIGGGMDRECAARAVGLDGSVAGFRRMPEPDASRAHTLDALEAAGIAFYVLMALGIVAAKMGRIRLGWIALGGTGCIGACMNFATPYFRIGDSVRLRDPLRARRGGVLPRELRMVRILANTTLIDSTSADTTCIARDAGHFECHHPWAGACDRRDGRVERVRPVGLVLVRRWDDRIAGWGRSVALAGDRADFIPAVSGTRHQHDDGTRSGGSRPSQRAPRVGC